MITSFYDYKTPVFPEIQILFVHKNSDSAKMDVIYCVISSALHCCRHSERRVVLASQTSLTPLGRNGRNIAATLALESKELVKSVRAILDMDCKFSAFFHFFPPVTHLTKPKEISSLTV